MSPCKERLISFCYDEDDDNDEDTRLLNICIGFQDLLAENKGFEGDKIGEKVVPY